jgi:hypothetical protein
LLRASASLADTARMAKVQAKTATLQRSPREAPVDTRNMVNPFPLT